MARDRRQYFDQLAATSRKYSKEPVAAPRKADYVRFI